jgi:uncharacterized protein (DUF885 family)
MHRPLSRRRALAAAGAAAAAAAAPWPAGAAARAGARVDGGAKLRALVEASDAAANRLDPVPRQPPGGDAGRWKFVDPLGDDSFLARRRNAERDREGLRAIDPATLGPVDRIARDVFEYRTERELERYRAGLAEVELRAPLNPSFGLHVELPDYVSGAGAPFATRVDYEVGLDRLEGFGRYLDSLVRRCREGLATGVVQSRVVAGKVAAQADAMLALPSGATPFHAALRRFPEGLGKADRARFTRDYERVVATRVLPGYARLRDFLRADYLPRATEEPGRWAMIDGLRLYNWELEGHRTVPGQARDVHATGLDEVARIRDEMERVRGRVGFAGDLPALFDYVRKDPRFYYQKPEELLARFAEIESRIWQGMPRLFARRPRAPFAVRALPALGDQRGTGYYKPGPADGVTPGVLWFNMSMLGTRPIPTLETLTLHEGIPGHHYQITLALEDPTLPAILRFGGLTAYSEGWGLYAESLGPELGMFEDPWQLFGHLDMEMLRAVRLVVDTGLHALQWPRQRAIDYMLANTSMAPRDVEVEIDRYIAQPGQACAYKAGELKLQELRARAAAGLGAGFDIRAFHGQVLDTGALPLAVLEAKVDRWIAAARA